jgi:hypothetical protein
MTFQIDDMTLIVEQFRRIKPNISQVLFSLTFIYCLCIVTNDFWDMIFSYCFFHWIWLTYIARKTIRHSLASGYGKSLTTLNIKLTLIVICGSFFVLVSSLSLLTRMVIGASGLGRIILYGTLIVYILSIIGHLFVVTINIQSIDKSLNKSKILLRLLIYPIGIWTIQETLKLE